MTKGDIKPNIWPTNGLFDFTTFHVIKGIKEIATRARLMSSVELIVPRPEANTTRIFNHATDAFTVAADLRESNFDYPVTWFTARQLSAL